MVYILGILGIHRIFRLYKHIKGTYREAEAAPVDRFSYHP